MAVIAGLAMKKFAIVGFLEEDNVIEVIPSTWILNASEAKWPTLSSPVVLAKYIKQCKPIDKEWKTLRIKIYGFSSTFISARNKANLAQDTSNLDSDSSLDNRLLSKQRRRKRPARYQSTDTSASENESNLKKINCVTPKLSKKSDSTLNDKQERHKRPVHYDSTDTSLSENESNSRKKNVPKLREKSVTSFNSNLLLKPRRRKRPARYQGADTSSSENESNAMKTRNSTFNGSSISNQRSHKKPARYRNSDASASENESHFKKKNSLSPKLINDALKTDKSKSNIIPDASHSKSNFSFDKESLTKVTEQKKPFSSPSKDKDFTQNVSIKEKEKHIESNKVSITSEKPKNTSIECDGSKLSITSEKPKNTSIECGGAKLSIISEKPKNISIECGGAKYALRKDKSKSNIIPDASHSKRNFSVDKKSLTKVTEQKSPSKDKDFTQNVSIKEKEKHIESNKVSITSEKPKNTSIECDGSKLNQILLYVEQIHEELKELNSKYESLFLQLNRLSRSAHDLTGVNICLPIDINLPVTSTGMLVKLNNKLRRDKEFSTALVHYLRQYGSGRKENVFLLSLVKKVLTPEVAICYSTCGRKGKKSFFDFPEVLNVLLTATTLKFKDSVNEDLLEMFDNLLAEAKDWLEKS